MTAPPPGAHGLSRTGPRVHTRPATATKPGVRPRPVSATAAYRVLARKYRPETFADLIGQEAMVRTLTNAFAAGRIAHAFLMTGIRGTGKTTTARIIAKGLNCIGPDGGGGPTVAPCGTCEPCRAIAAGRHVDVLEMDAASRTGVADIREIIEGVAYRTAAARYKVYIIDEVHMLSTSAFNALLKTLEEPPPHVKFIFATTEVRKLPVTVLSRCQRFDLRRIEPEVMLAHLARIAAAEGAAIAAEALGLIVRAAEGSVRDALSLLDQAIAHGGGEASAEDVRAMLGLADRGRVLDLFDLVMAGDAAGALGELAAQYAAGADPLAVLRDLAETTHWVSVIKITPAAADDPPLAADARARGRDMAGRLPMAALGRTWTLLLRALEEVAAAPNAMMAAEMALIRLTHVVDLPDPDDLLRRLRASDGGGAAHRPAAAPPPGAGPRLAAVGRAVTPVLAPAPASSVAPASALAPAAASALAPVPAPASTAAPLAVPVAVPGPAAAPRAAAAFAAWPGFADVLALLAAAREAALLFDVEVFVRLVRYAPGQIEFAPAPRAPADLAPRLAGRLRALTGLRWGVVVVAGEGAPTAAEAREARARAHPLVQAVLAAFPAARLAEIRDLAPPADEAAATAAAPPPGEEEGDWDPFEAD
ncbi:MAG: DNA polymerase III subunit gamma/tau [Rhodobacteraceae bacterium]|nr:DNA polymerase III subunit gamma/tau [Paracoccaceae bacterium]